MFNANFDVLLYDLTSTYFEINASDVAEGDKRRHGYSRDKRPDCPQVVIALVVTTDGLPLAYEVLPGNTADCTTLRMFLARIEQQYGRARRVWVMDRGIPTEAVLTEMRASDPPVQYLVGTPKGRLSRLEKQLLAKPWQEARAGVQVKLLAEDNELYVYAESVDRVSKERAMRKRQLKWLWKRLRELAAMEIPREEMLMKLGAARARAPTAWRLVDIEMDKESAMFIYTLNRQKLRRIRRRDGRYLLRTNLTENDPALLWQYYTQLVAVEEKPISRPCSRDAFAGGLLGLRIITVSLVKHSPRRCRPCTLSPLFRTLSCCQGRAPHDLQETLEPRPGRTAT